MGISHKQRRKLREIPIKKGGFKKLAKDCIQILKIIKADGPIGHGKIMEKTGIPKGTVDRRLTHLKELGVIGQIKRKYVYHSDIFIFNNKTDRDLALKHSKNLSLGLKFIQNSLDESLISNTHNSLEEIYLKCAFKHLITGYPKKYNSYKKFKELQETWKMATQNLKEKIMLKLPHSIELFNQDDIVNLVLEDITNIIQNKSAKFFTRLVIERNKVVSYYYELGPEKEYKKIKKFIKNQEENESNKKEVCELLDLETEFNNIKQKVRKDIDQLILMIENYNPLKGFCNLCPKVITIKPQKIMNASARLLAHLKENN